MRLSWRITGSCLVIAAACLVLGGLAGQGIAAPSVATKAAWGAAGALALLGAAGLGCALYRSVRNPLRNATRVIGEIRQGNTTGLLPRGTPVNCSARKKCGVTDCPSYGKVDYCWITSGSFAAFKRCPRAIRGEDCRTCELYTAKDEMQEMGSMVAGLTEYFSGRMELALSISNGDLSKEVELASDQDSLGKALQVMHQSLQSIVGELQAGAGQIVSGSSQVSDASQTLSQGATEQASSLEEISSSLAEISSQSRQNAENAGEADTLARQAMETATTGNGRMQELAAAMRQISSSSENIKKIVNVIDDIAFQTNLLALNANVEAARAGKYGKGFAVVAEEVRNLAVRSAEAVRETTGMVEQSIRSISDGGKAAEATAQQLDAIVKASSRVAEFLGEIAVASREQALGVEQIDAELDQIGRVTQANTASAEESASAAEELAAQAQQLRGMIARFHLGSGAASAEGGQVGHQGAARGADAPAAGRGPMGTRALLASGNGRPQVIVHH